MDSKDKLALLARIDQWLATLGPAPTALLVLLRDCRTRIAANAALAARCGELERDARQHWSARILPTVWHWKQGGIDAEAAMQTIDAAIAGDSHG